MSKRVALYLRVSTTGQTVENQRAALLEVCERAGWTVIEEYVDHGISGAKGRDKRPAFDRMLKDATRRRFDMIAAWSVDRLGRSMQDLVNMLSEIQAAGVDLFLHQQALDTSTPNGKAMFGMLSVFAEFERSMIRERVGAGLARAKSQGKTLGRPKADADLVGRIRAELINGTGIVKAAKIVGCGTSTVARVKREMAEAA